MEERRRSKIVIALLTLVFVAGFSLINTHSKPQTPVHLDPPYVEALTGDEFTIAIKVDPGSHGVSGGEINVAFKTNVLDVADVKPGDLFGPEPLVGYKEINETVGIIGYALARRGATSPPTLPGTFAVVKFKVRKEAKPNTYSITLTKVGLADENFKDIPKNEIKLGNSTINVKPIPPPTPTVTVTKTVTPPTVTVTQTVTLTPAPTPTPSPTPIILYYIMYGTTFAAIVFLALTAWLLIQRRKPARAMVRHCRKCGSELSPQARFCRRCGTKQD